MLTMFEFSVIGEVELRMATPDQRNQRFQREQKIAEELTVIVAAALEERGYTPKTQTGLARFVRKEEALVLARPFKRHFHVKKFRSRFKDARSLCSTKCSDRRLRTRIEDVDCKLCLLMLGQRLGALFPGGKT